MKKKQGKNGSSFLLWNRNGTILYEQFWNELVADDNCEYDANAVKITHDGICLGYIPHGLAKTMRQIMGNYSFTTQIARVNGTKERPRILIFVEAK